MAQCPSCRAPVTTGNRYCPNCGGELTISSTPTLHVGGGDSQRTSETGTATRPESDPRFFPGTLVSDRYRIGGVLGRGGMGEVYRADDTKLGEPVALKFLPVELASDSTMVNRFHEEVRISRQISHPNVCTVHDIGEAEGHPYLSMEYVDGEDLSSLLKRVGRLSREKAAEIGRQVCAGLAAAHAKGVIHRDLKPSNILIDGQGQARVTDFGLAAVAREITGADVRSGTPAYMAPEQLAGEQVTAASDIYSLGLILFEIFTGRKAFEKETLARRLEGTTQMDADEITSRARDLDPPVGRTIRRCLDPDPARRPASALEVAASLPGADVLAAALAAGETPSPEVVAAAGSRGGLNFWVAAACLALTLSGLVAWAAFSDRLYLFERVPLDRPPDVLAEQARQILDALGLPAAAGSDEARGFYYRANYIRHLENETETPQKWDQVAAGQPAAVGFWYRRSPVPMQPLNLERSVGPDDPPLTVAGMASLRLDTRGRLLRLLQVPAATVAGVSETDWNVLLTQAGVDLQQLEPVEPRQIPPVFADRRVAWQGRYSDAGHVEVRVEAASWAGLPVFFQVFEPWDPAPGESVEANEMSVMSLQSRTGFVLMLVLAALFGMAVWLAQRNIRQGRGDRQGALRVAAFAFAGLTVSLLLHGHRLPHSINDWGIAGAGPLALALPLAALVWLIYVAIEPYVRKLWPRVLISWERLLRGEWKDPMIGRDILAGGVLAAWNTALVIALYAQSDWQLPPARPTLRPLLAGGEALSLFLDILTFSAPFNPLLLVLFILVLQVVLRRRWLALGAAGTLLAVAAVAGQDDLIAGPLTPLLAVLQVAGVVATLVVLMRFGVLAVVVASAFQQILLLYPAALDPQAWYATTTFAPYAVISALAVFGFVTSLAGRQPFDMADL